MKHVLLAMVLALAAAVPSQALREVNKVDGYDGYVECLTYRQLDAGDDYPGAWEYIYDVYGGSQASTQSIGLRGFDATSMLNLETGASWNTTSPTDQYLWQRRDAHSFMGYAFWGWDQWKDYSPSTWEDTGGSVYDWVLTGRASATLNNWHVPDDYHVHEWGMPMLGEAAVVDDGLNSEGLMFDTYAVATDWTGLYATFRVVRTTLRVKSTSRRTTTMGTAARKRSTAS